MRNAHVVTTGINLANAYEKNPSTVLFPLVKTVLDQDPSARSSPRTTAPSSTRSSTKPVNPAASSRFS